MRPILISSFLVLLVPCCLLGDPAAPPANTTIPPAAPGASGAPGEIFPALPSAQKAVSWKDGYFYLNGQPTFISSGSIHYARVPRELWRDRIWRLQQMGFNCAQSYVFWNATEPKEGQWDFNDNLDLNAWLSLLKEMNMFALVRVGPYSCAEWEEGGYPAWLTVKPGMTWREMGPSVPFSDAHLGKLEAITAKNQINHGGSVFLVQLENEHSRGWGTSVEDPYLKYLDDQARANGIEVPMFNSGLHHSAEPSGEVPFPPDPSPWYSTEFWTGWIGKYGEMPPATIAEKVRGSWKAIAFGGAGYNYYMAHGGTNFGYSGDTFATSYDYSAPIGEAGQLRAFYFAARRAAYFAQTFTPLLTGSRDDPTLAKSDQPALRVTSRTNPTGGSIIFIDHFFRKAGVAPVAYIAPVASAYHAPTAGPDVALDTHITVGNLTLPHQGSFKVATVEPRTIIVNLPWTANTTFESICTNVLFRKLLDGVDYWVCYGPAGDNGEVTLSRKNASTAPAQFDFTYPKDDSVQETDVDSGDGSHAKLLVMNTEMTGRAWLAHDKLYLGPSFVLEDGSMEFPTDGGTATIYSASGKSVVTQPAVKLPDLPALAAWTSRDGAPEAKPEFDSSKWLTSTGPQPMETYDSFQNRYGWYRTTLHRDAAGPVSLRFAEQSGTFTAYLNGQPAAPITLAYGASGSLSLPDAKAGDNTLAILVKSTARAKGPSYGAIGRRMARGIWGGVTSDPAATPLVITWKKGDKVARDAVPDDLAKADYDDSTWSAVDTTSPAMQMHQGNSWYRGIFTLTPDQVDSIVEVPRFGSSKKDGRGNFPEPAKIYCYINGHLLDERVQDASKYLVAGKNTVLLEIQSRLGEDTGDLTLSLWHNSPLASAKWYFHGGLDDLDETAVIGRTTNWSEFLKSRPWQANASASPGQPVFWKCTFAYQQPAGMRQTLGLVTDGLKAGHVWLNGHNLGECPQTVLMYMPECWLKDGDNDLVIFDLQGTKPDQVKLARYESFALAPAK